MGAFLLFLADPLSKTRNKAGSSTDLKAGPQHTRPLPAAPAVMFHANTRYSQINFLLIPSSVHNNFESGTVLYVLLMPRPVGSTSFSWPAQPKRLPREGLPPWQPCHGPQAPSAPVSAITAPAGKSGAFLQAGDGRQLCNAISCPFSSS